ncbi:hypothetical protein [Mycobacterium decipiens]|uniref:DUF7937 domain-containing protein n=1 Tax=Mycobacterium decipiens TaxID=1430326 RepID=UPI001F6086F2|nr:hypothetical protein [Mycobacterium decipiens]
MASAPAPQPAPAGSGPRPDSTRRRDIVVDLTAGVLLVLALFFPWNLYFGFRIPDSNPNLLALLLAVTLLSLASLAIALFGPRLNPALVGRLRLGLNVPYLLLVLGFVVFDAIQTIRSGGTVNVPGGVGPGGWLGITGALLSAQPMLVSAATDEDGRGRWLRAAQILGYASMFGAALSTGFNLSWRVKYALQPAAGASGFGKQNLAVIDTAVVYGVVALVAVVVASRWLLRATEAHRLSTVALGASTLAAGIIVWSLPIGREIDAFHGIAQNTSTAGVGYEGYLAWAAAAAIFAPLTLFRSPTTPPIDKAVWRAAARNGLLLIAVWCVGSVAMRLTDLLVAVMLNYPFSRYDSMTLAAFDLAAAVLAIWIRVNLATETLPGRLISALCGFLFMLTVSRVIVGIVLAPRFQASPGASPNPVYGNNLAQQITSIFDVVLCGLALGILAAAIVIGRRRRPPQRPRHPRRPRRPGRIGAPAAAPVPSAAQTTRITAAGTADSHTTVLSRPAGSPRIFRSAEPTQQVRPKIYRPPDDSS